MSAADTVKIIGQSLKGRNLTLNPVNSDTTAKPTSADFKRSRIRRRMPGPNVPEPAQSHIRVLPDTHHERRRVRLMG